MQRDKQRLEQLNRIFTKTTPTFNTDKEVEVSEKIKSQLQSYISVSKNKEEENIEYRINDILDATRPSDVQESTWIYVYSIEYQEKPILYTLLLIK